MRFNTAGPSLHRQRRLVRYLGSGVRAAIPNALAALLNGMAGEVDLDQQRPRRCPTPTSSASACATASADWNTSVAVTRIDSKDGFVFTLGNRYPNGDFWQNRSQPWGNSPPGLAGVLLVGDNGIETKSTQVLLSADKPFTAGFALGRDVRVHVHRRGAESRHQRALRYSTTSSINEYPFILSNAAAKHRVVATGSYRGAVGIHASPAS